MTKDNVIAYVVQYLALHGGEILWKIFLAFLVFVVGYLVAKRIVANIRTRIESQTVQPQEYAKKISHLVGAMIFILLMIFVLLAVFQVIGFDAALIMGGLSLGVGFAMETTITNMISGVVLLTNEKIKLGDYVKFLGTLKIAGIIDEINIRYTVIKTFDKRRIIVPNGVIASTPIQTMKSEPLVRGEIVFTLPRHVLFDQIQKLMLDTINAHPSVAHKEFSNVFIAGFTNAGVLFKSYFFVDQTTKKSAFIVGRDLKNKVFDVFRKYGISLPYEHMTLTVE